MNKIGYRELKIPAELILKKWVVSIYELKTVNSELVYTVVPNGYIGLMLTLSGASCIGSLENKNPTNAVCGMITEPMKVMHLKNSYEICLVFNPVLLQVLLNDRMNIFSKGQIVRIDEVLSKHEIDLLQEKLCLSKTDRELLSHLQSFLSPYFTRRTINKLALELYRKIDSLEADSIKQLCSYFSVSSTTIRNWSNESIGISPKELIQIKRLHKTLTIITDQKSVADIYFQLNYYDQAHFIKFFKEKCGMTPMQYLKNKKLAFDFYNYKRWLATSFDD